MSKERVRPLQRSQRDQLQAQQESNRQPPHDDLLLCAALGDPKEFCQVPESQHTKIRVNKGESGLCCKNLRRILMRYCIHIRGLYLFGRLFPSLSSTRKRKGRNQRDFPSFL